MIINDKYSTFTVFTNILNKTNMDFNVVQFRVQTNMYFHVYLFT